MSQILRYFAVNNIIIKLIIFTLFIVGLVIFRIEVPPLMDYPNHLARYWLISGGARLAPLSSMYEIDWTRASVVGTDVLAMVLCWFVPYTVAGKLLVFFAFAGPPAGLACLSRIFLAAGTGGN